MGDPELKRIAVIGSRDFDDYGKLESVLESHLPAVLVSGGAKGADALAERLAQERGLTIDVIPADWKRYSRGPVRSVINRSLSRRILSSPFGMANPAAPARR